MISWMFFQCLVSLSSLFLFHLFCMFFFLTYLWTVSSAWFAWSECPPLHPCCHCGNQPAQTNPKSHNNPLFIPRSYLSACRASLQLPARPWILKGLLPPVALRSVTEGRLSLFSWFSWISDPFSLPLSLPLHTQTHKLLCATPLSLCLVSFIRQPFPLYQTPFLLMQLMLLCQSWQPIYSVITPLTNGRQQVKDTLSKLSLLYVLLL